MAKNFRNKKIHKAGLVLGLFCCCFLIQIQTSTQSVFAACAKGCVEVSIFGDNGPDGIKCSCDTAGDSVLDILSTALNIFSMIVLVLGAAGIIVVGIQYMTAGGDEGQTRKAKRRMLEIVIGLAAYFLAFGVFSWLGVAPSDQIANDGMTDPPAGETVFHDDDSSIYLRYDAERKSKSVVVTVSVTDEKFAYLKNPDDTINTNKLSTYTINKNGSYTFTAYAQDDSKISSKTITVSNVDESSDSGGSGDSGTSPSESDSPILGCGKPQTFVASRKYNFTDGQLRGLIGVARHENGFSMTAKATEISFFANLFEYKGLRKGWKNTEAGFINYIRNGGWFATNSTKDWSEKREVSSQELSTAKSILNGGNHTLPPEVVHHDWIGDVKKVVNNGKEFDKYDVSQYIPGKTEIYTKYNGGKPWVFYTWADPACTRNSKKDPCGDPFGYNKGSVPAGC